MSDRPCNLSTWLDMRKRDNARSLRLRSDASSGFPGAVAVVDDDGAVVRWYASLPSPADCAAFGGSCEC
jgi:hypothetical protein